MPRTLKDVLDAKTRSVEELEAVYQCNKLEDISKCFAIMHTELWTNISCIASEVIDMRSRMSKLEEKQSHVKCEVDTLKSLFRSDLEGAKAEAKHDLETISTDIDTKLKNLSNDLTKLDIWGRKWNLVVKGVPGDLNETSSSSKKVLKSFMLNQLKLPRESVDVMPLAAVHRLPGGREGKRNIIVRFVDLADRDMVLNATRNLAGRSGFAVVTDLPPIVAKRRSNLLNTRFQLSQTERKHFKVRQIKDAPFVVMVDDRV